MTIKEFKIQLAVGSLPYHVRSEWAKNLDTPIDILQLLCDDKKSNVRYIIIHNSNTTEAILAYIICNDPDQYIRDAATNKKIERFKVKLEGIKDKLKDAGVA